MEDLLKELLEKAKTDKKTFSLLKQTAVKAQHFELAVKLREIEKGLFPESDEVREAKERANKLNLLFRMVELNVSHEMCYLIDKTLELYNKKSGEVSIMDASDILVKRNRIFEKD